ncbi:MAG: hypothetical protein ACSHXY_03480 [Alphaproteobacteria bacterium]
MSLLEIAKRGIADTFGFFGWTLRSLIWPALMLLGALMHYKATGSASGPKEELFMWVTYTLAPVGVVAILLLMFNLAAAPFRIERDAHKKTKLLAIGARADESTQRFFQARQKFTLKEAASILSGTEFTWGDLSGAATGYLSDLEDAALERRLVVTPPIGRMDAHMYELSGRSGYIELYKKPDLSNREITKAELIKYADTRDFGLPDYLHTPSKALTHQPQ